MSEVPAPPSNLRTLNVVAKGQAPAAEPGAAVRHLRGLIEAIENGSMPEPEFGITIMGFTDYNEAPIHMEFGTKEVHPYMIVGLLAEAKIMTLAATVDEG